MKKRLLIRMFIALKYKEIIFFYFFLLYLFFGCHKDDNTIKEEIPYEKFSQDVLDWGYFKTGSYWIYRNDSTNALDSLVVDTSIYRLKNYHPQHDSHDIAFYWDYFSIRYRNNIFKIYNDDAGSNCKHEHIVSDIWRNTEFNGFPLIMACEDSLVTDSWERSVTYYQTYIIGTNTFQNVSCIKIVDFINHKTKYFYLAKHIGTVKIQLSDSISFSSHSLIKWNVLQ